MPKFNQLPGEPACSFAQLLVHRDAGPARLYRQTAVLTDTSESTLRRRAERWDWEKRLEEYDAVMLRQIELESTAEGLQRYKQQLKEFRDVQLDRAHRLGRLADDLMELVQCSIMHYQEQNSFLHGREIPAVLTSSCKAMDASITTEATALGVTELLEQYLD
jgi:hypothetical protein